MTTYTDPFAVQKSNALSRVLTSIDLQKNTTLNWPEGYSGPDFIASINQVASYDATFALTLPPATGASEGTAALFMNIGALPFNINDNSGTQLTTVAAGETKYLFCADTETTAGVWRVLTFGTGTSAADAASLAGQGLSAIGGKLAAAHTVSTSASDIAISTGDRGKVFAASAGSVTLNLPSYNAVGNGFFFGANNGGSGTMKIQAPTGSTIDGFNSISLAPNESVFVFCSGTGQWYTIGYGRSTQFQFTKLVKDISAGATITLTSAEASNKLLQFIGNPATDTTVVVPSVVGIYYVQCSYSGSNALTIKTLTGAGVSLSSSDRVIIYCDGVDIVSAQSVAVGTNLSVVDGSINSPAIGFAADPNTGLYRADAETVGLVSNGAEAARFNYVESSVTGKLGVGTIAPAAQLHVKAGTAEGLRIQGTNSFMSFYDTAGNTRQGIVAGYSKELRDSVDDITGTRTVYIGGTKVLTVTKDGVVVTGTIQSSGAPYATLGDNAFTGIQVMPVLRSKVVSLGNISGTPQLDLAAGSTFTGTIVGNTTFSFKNSPPAGQDQTVYLKLTNAGAYSVGFVNGTKFPNSGVAPVLTAAGRDLLAVWYDIEQTSYVVGLVWKDYK